MRGACQELQDEADEVDQDLAGPKEAFSETTRKEVCTGLEPIVFLAPILMQNASSPTLHMLFRANVTSYLLALSHCKFMHYITVDKQLLSP